MPKRKHHTEEEIIRILKEAENGLPIADLLRKYNISQGTYCRWKGSYNGMDVNELKRLKELEKENARLKKLVKPATRRAAVDHLIERYGAGLTRSCGLMSISRSSYAYESRRPDDEVLRNAIRKIRLLNIVDDYTREAIWMEVATSISGTMSAGFSINSSTYAVSLNRCSPTTALSSPEPSLMHGPIKTASNITSSNQENPIRTPM